MGADKGMLDAGEIWRENIDRAGSAAGNEQAAVGIEGHSVKSAFEPELRVFGLSNVPSQWRR